MPSSRSPALTPSPSMLSHSQCCGMAPFLLVLLAVLLPAPRSLGAGYGEGAGTINITKVLAGFPEFSNFSAMLTETNVARSINSRDKVTVLAPNNTAVAVAFGGLPKIPRSFLADLIALHVVLDYVDEPTLGTLKKGRVGKGSVVTTLLQAMRTVPRGTGFLRVFSGPDGRAMVSSAAPAGQRNATVERVVVAQPYSLAVLHVSGFVVPPGVRVPKPFPPPGADAPKPFPSPGADAPKPFPPRRARHMAAPPHQAPAAAPGHRHIAAPPRHAPVPAPGPHSAPPFIGSGPLVPSPIRPLPTPSLTHNPPAAPGAGVIPIPTHGGMAAKVPAAAGAGRIASSWWAGVAVALGIMTCLNLHL